jgi:low affinity Fe/Cu permease
MFQRIATFCTELLGHPLYILFSFLIVSIWAMSGPFFGYSDTWQLVINTGTTILTWLMLGFVQYTQNRDTKAIQTKLDELIKADPKADNKVRGIEHEGS